MYDNNVQLVVSAHFHGYFKKVIGTTTYITTGGVNNFLEVSQEKHFLRITINGTQLTTQKVTF